MADRILVAPSILAADQAALGDAIRAVEAAGADWIHVDVMDGHFVPNLTIGPPVIASLRTVTDLPLDVHLMIEEPERSIQQYADAGADRITVHVEACVHLDRTLHQIREAGAAPGVALNPSTSSVTLMNVLHLVDTVMVMTVNPGFGGQAFIPEVMPKLRTIRHQLDRLDREVLLEVDGGISPATTPQVTGAGANVLVAGAAVFSSDDYAATIDAMVNAALPLHKEGAQLPGAV